MESEFQSCSLADIYDFASGLSKARSEFGAGHPFLGFKDVFYNSAVPKELKELVRSTDREREKCSVKRGDVFLTRTSETMNELGMSCVSLRDIPFATFNGFTKRLRPRAEEVIAPEYARYYFRSNLFRANVNSMSTMSTRASLNNEMLSRLQISFPNIREQQAIGEILGTLDDKIELNRKTNETLEGIAKALFKSWFVDFDPVRAKAEGRLTGLPDEISELFPNSFEESELGEIPSGWLPSSVGEISKNLDRLRVPLSKKQRGEKQGSFPYYGATGIFDYVDDFLFDGDYLLIGEDGSVAKDDGTAFSQYVSGKIWVNNHAHVLEGVLPVTTEFLYCFFQFAQVMPYVTGAVQLKLSQGRMNMIQLPLADEELLCLFGEIVQPIFKRRLSIHKEILSLGELRDALLPRLISGELRVPDAEKMLEEVGI
mgnify:CR=1 FL=1